MQRVASARVEVGGVVVGRCGRGLVVLVAAHREDTLADAAKLAQRIVGMRIFNDADGKMNLNLEQVEAEHPSDEANILAISNFTVYGDTAQSRRPSFTAAAGFELGQSRFAAFLSALADQGARVETGEFGADMQVHLVNDGPVTLVIEAGPSGGA